MPGGHAVVAVDLGTSKVCTIVAENLADGRMAILGVGLCPARGMAKGVITDLEEAASAVARSMERAERGHRGQLRGLRGGRRLVIELRDDLGLIRHGVDRALATAPEFVAERKQASSAVDDGASGAGGHDEASARGNVQGTDASLRSE